MSIHTHVDAHRSIEQKVAGYKTRITKLSLLELGAYAKDGRLNLVYVILPKG